MTRRLEGAPPSTQWADGQKMGMKNLLKTLIAKLFEFLIVLKYVGLNNSSRQN